MKKEINKNGLIDNIIRLLLFCSTGKDVFNLEKTKSKRIINANNTYTDNPKTEPKGEEGKVVASETQLTPLTNNN